MIGKNEIIYFIVAVILIVGIVTALAIQNHKSAPRNEAYANFAQCINDSGAVFWGAFWCPHCAQQKAIFGDSANLLPYKECSERDRSLKQICRDEYITGFPTWRFENGLQCGGEIKGLVLAHLTNCAYPKYKGGESITSVDAFEEIFLSAAKNNLQRQVQLGQSTISEIEAELKEFEDGVRKLFEERFGYSIEESKDPLEVAELFATSNCHNTEDLKEAFRKQELLNILDERDVDVGDVGGEENNGEINIEQNSPAN